MQVLIVGLVVLFAYFFIRLLTSFGGFMAGARYRAYRQLAARYHGRYETRGMSDTPTVSFSHRGSLIRVGLAPTIAGQPDQIPRTRVVSRFQKGIPLRLELAPKARPAPPQAPKGTRLVRVGDDAFDGAFVVQANDAEMARDFLTPASRATVVQLARLAPEGGMLVSINPERMLVQVDRNLGRYAWELGFAVSEALTLHDGLLQGVAGRMSQGIAIVNEPMQPGDDVGPAICKVCSEPIAGGPVITCAVCKTPHHRDCWEYVGACSIYGCGGKVGVSG